MGNRLSEGVIGLALAGAAAGFAGCGTALFPSGSAARPDLVEDGNADPSGLRTIGAARGEPNGDFDLAIPVIFDDGRRGALRGSVHAFGDLDVYNLGPLRAGDRVLVEVDGRGGVLDSSIAIFDAAERIFIENDDSAAPGRALDARIDQVVRHGSDAYYLVIGASAFAGSAAERVGPYRIAVSIAEEEPPTPVRQTLLLDFDGGTVDAPTVPVSFVEPFDADQILRCCSAGHRSASLTTIEPFEAEKIAVLYAGQTDALKEVIVRMVRDDFTAFGVDVVTSDDPLPEEGTYSTVFFGGSNPIAFGIAESIDHYNRVPDDVVVIFTDSFGPEVFSPPPGVEGLGTAIANVASHEAGHILGLNHVDNLRDLMDAVSPPDTLLEDQEFTISPLSAQIMPLGLQDGRLLLEETVGPK